MSEENVVQDTPENGSNEDVSIPELEEFIFRPDEYTDFIVPRRLSPPKVAAFLKQKVKKDTTLESFVQVERAAVFYDSNEVTETYRSFLDKSESGSEQIVRSIVIARIIAVLGNRDDRGFAKNYYEYLVSKVDSVEEFEEIILLHEALGLGSASKSIRARIKAVLASLEGSKDSDFQAEIKHAKLEQSIDLKLRQAEEVLPIKNKILEIEDRKERLVEEIKLYMFNPYGAPELFDNWSARRIRQETWAKQPDEQSKRVDEQPFKRNVTIALRDFLTDLDKYKTLGREERDAARLRLLRAIEFFEGQITEQEAQFVKSFAGKQLDLIANSGYLIEGE